MELTKSVVLVEYPKSGGNWLVNLIGDALKIPKRDIYMQGDWKVFDATHHPWYVGLIDFDFPVPCVIKSHELPSSGLIDFDAIYVHLVRDGRDVVVSKYFYEKDFCVKNGLTSDFNLEFKEYLPKVAREWAEFVDSWKRENVITIHYERFLSDTVGELGRLLRILLGKDIDYSYLSRIVSENTKEETAKSFDKTFKYNTFVRKATSGDWKNYFDDSDLVEFNSIASGTMVDFNYYPSMDAGNAKNFTKNSQQNKIRSCWCGNVDLFPFGAEYGECHVCGTLVYLKEMAPNQLLVRDDEADFYGKKYWLEHQQADFGYADIHTRARNDLSERNLHWLKTLVKYKLPPSKMLELGCAHGSFVALLQQAGYDSSGVEMSPWVVEFGQKTFDVPIVAGPVESLDLPAGSFDVIALMDVLEHLPDPVVSMAHCLQLLKPDGLLLIQTPQFKEGVAYSSLVETKGAFIEQLKIDEHLYLYSAHSVARLFSQLGAEYIHFEPAIFGHYDMFFVASRAPLHSNNSMQIDSALLATPNGRITLSLLDVYERELDLVRKLKESETDRSARGEQIDALTAMLRESEVDRLERAKQIEALSQMLQQTEAGQLARSQQIETLSGLFKESETDRTARGEQIDVLTSMLRESEADRLDRAKQIETLSGLFKESETDRIARGEQIDVLTSMLRESEADRLDRAKQIETLSGLFKESETDRTARGEQIDVLTSMLRESEADRLDRAKQIETLSGLFKESEEDRTARGEQIDTLTAMLRESKSDRLDSARHIESLTKMLQQTEVDRSRHVEQVEAILLELRVLFGRSSFRWLSKLSKWQEVDNLAKRIAPSNENND